jgi:hypothetical protein
MRQAKARPRHTRDHDARRKAGALERVMGGPAVRQAPREVRNWLRLLLERGERASSADATPPARRRRPEGGES